MIFPFRAISLLEPRPFGGNGRRLGLGVFSRHGAEFRDLAFEVGKARAQAVGGLRGL